MSRKYLIPALLAISSSAFAQSTAPKFTDVDKDGNGSLSTSELSTAGLSTSMSTADTDKNGSVSQTEFDASMKAKGSTGGSSTGSSSMGGSGSSSQGSGAGSSTGSSSGGSSTQP